MTALLHWTPMILNHAHSNGLTVCLRRRNLLQTLELRNSSSRASQLKTFSRFNGNRAAPGSSASSSVILATSNIQAHGLQDGNGGVIQSPQFSAMNSQYELPKNVAIIMLQEVYDNDDSKVFLCLANIFEVEENGILSKSARVDLQTLFSNQEIDEVDSANQKKSEMMKKLQWCIEEAAAAAAAESSDKNTPPGDPMIKTTPHRDPMIKSGSMETQQSAPNIELYLHL